MLWEELTAQDFATAVKETKGTCLFPVGVCEKHGNHLPLGTDLFVARAVAMRAAELEPAIIFPPYYFSQICEAEHQPGTIAADTQFLLSGLEMMCREMARNGLKKIIIVNGHGGNGHLLPFFAQMTLRNDPGYTVYVTDGFNYTDQEIENIIEDKEGGHACELETSLVMAVCPDLVHMDRADPEIGRRMTRLDHLSEILYTSLWWYGRYPHHQAGDPTRATIEKGRRLLEISAEKVARIIREVKKDTVLPKLAEEFYHRASVPVD